MTTILTCHIHIYTLHYIHLKSWVRCVVKRPFVWSSKERTCANMLVWRVLMLWLCVTSPGRNVCPLHLDTWQVSRRSQSRAEERGRDAGWQWQQGPGPDSYYHSDYIQLYHLYYLLLLLLLLTTNTNTQEQEDARVWWNHVPYSYPHPAYGENDWRWSLDQWPQQCFFFNFPCKLCINLPHLSGVHGLSQADVDLVIAKAKRVVEGSKAAMVRLTFNDCVGK